MTQQPENFSELIKNVREQLGYSQEELARELGVSFASVNRWENKKTKPSRLALKQVESFCKKMVSQKRLKRTGR